MSPGLDRVPAEAKMGPVICALPTCDRGVRYCSEHELRALSDDD